MSSQSKTSRSKRTMFSYFNLSTEQNRESEASSPPVEFGEQIVDATNSKSRRTDCGEFDINRLERDPGLRRPILSYPANEVDAVRRAYIQLGPFQPQEEYPRKQDGKQFRRFQYAWFAEHPWLEYSVAEDKAFCFPCFLFDNVAKNHAFTTDGYCNWKRVGGTGCNFKRHVGDIDSRHNKCMKDWSSLSVPSKHIDKVINVQSTQQVCDYRLRLKTSIESIMWLARQGCAFRGHDESSTSSNRENFIEKVKSYASINEDIKRVVLENAPKNAKYTLPDTQKEVLNILANKVRNLIREEIGEAKFCILVDEAVDEGSKEQMIIILRYVNNEGFVQERFFDIVSVEDTTAKTLKKAITDVLTYHNLAVGDMRGQGYDGASNMRGEWNGLKALFLEDCPYAYYVHCFAHRLQLALVGVAKHVGSVYCFFQSLNTVVNVLTASPKRLRQLKTTRGSEVVELLDLGDLESGQGANQICTLQQVGPTRWSSHYNSVRSLIILFKSVSMNLEDMMINGEDMHIRGMGKCALRIMRSFEFVFILLLMDEVLGITNSLCLNLQRLSQDIINAMNLVSVSKELLLQLRFHGWSDFLDRVIKFCEENEVQVPTMSAQHMEGIGRTCQQQDSITVEHHYQNDIFNEVVDFQSQELERRFSDKMVKLLSLCAAFDPVNKYESFKVDDICELATEFYPRDFTVVELHELRKQLAQYHKDVVSHLKFQQVSSLSEVCQVLCATRKKNVYFLVDRLIRLVLTLPVSTATTERAFSAMKIVKTRLHNKMEDEYLADNLVVFIERDLAGKIDSDSVIDTFYAIKQRKVQLQ